MANKHLEQKNLILTIDVSELDKAQIRLIKSIAAMLGHVMTTDDECDYFDGSSDLLRMIAGAVKQANFTKDFVEKDPNIPYADQALEFCLENLTEQIFNNDLVNYDN